MFRASPWISFQPSVPDYQDPADDPDDDAMDEDVDMDAPQISTLREEETPPPQRNPSHNNRFRVKLLVKDSKGTGPPSGATSRKGAGGQTEDEDEDEEDEEDQLIDDDDDNPIPPVALPSRAVDAASKRKPAGKRKPRKTEKRAAEDDRKMREKLMQAESHAKEESSHGGVLDGGHPGISLVSPELVLSKASPKKKTAPRNAPAPRPKTKPIPKKPKAAALLPILADDTGVLSEGYTGTAASSPVTAHFDLMSPEPENMAPSVHSGPLVEDSNLDNIPLPIYPLPSKPFPVQPPPKIGTGLAPMIPLDKGGKKVRHWRTANREIRGIAGGRWFARSWVGEKESEFASAAAAAAAIAKGAHAASEGDKQPTSGAVALPKLSAVSISAPPSGRGSGKPKVPKLPITGSAGPSRAGSVIPDTSTRPPTKMRTILSAVPPSEGGNDSDTVVAPP